nr:hypothetical protein GW17_00007083 [Ipomoea batatas]
MKASPEPIRKNCGMRLKTLMCNVETLRPSDLATLSLLCSVIAAIPIPMVESARPMAILCRLVKPVTSMTMNVRHDNTIINSQGDENGGHKEDDLVEDDKHGKSREDKKHTTACIVEKIAMVLNLPRKESARKPPSKQRRKDVPMKSVTTLAEVELG